MGVSDGVADGLSSGSGVGIGLAFFRFDLLVGAGVGVGVAFFRRGDAVGDGVAVGFFAECCRCLRAGLGVGVGARIFLIFLPNDSSAAGAACSVPNNSAAMRNHPNVRWNSINLVGRFCELRKLSRADTDALQFTPENN